MVEMFILAIVDWSFNMQLAVDCFNLGDVVEVIKRTSVKRLVKAISAKHNITVTLTSSTCCLGM